MTCRYFLPSVLLVIAAAEASLPSSAHACGGLFCDNTNQVNQAAERIIFSHNPDGTITAVIEIQYDGPSDRFSWVLPIPGVPDLAVSSKSAFDRLQRATDPRYLLQTTFPPECPPSPDAGLQAENEDGGVEDDRGPVMVLASGTVGPYDYDVISLDPDVDDPAAAALMWLEMNDYDVTALAPEVLGPYLADGLNLMAFRLTKDSDTGSIRPIVVRYESERSFIPIRPTAVAANDDMGVLVFVLGEARAVPINYKALELNEALINWFNPGPTYDLVVSAAADEAQGHGFVTELAGPSELLENAVVGSLERDAWGELSTGTVDDVVQFIVDTARLYGTWDGYRTALIAALTLPAGVDFDAFSACPNCYAGDPDLELDVEAFRAALADDVIEPMLSTQRLLSSRPYVTRLYTTLSAHEMTMDPMFAENPDLRDVDNVHMADQERMCDGSFRVQLPQGDVVVGQNGVWPFDLGGDLPATRKILQYSTQGQGVVIVDNEDAISDLLEPDARDGGAGESDAGRDGGSDSASRDGGGMGDGGAAAASDDDGCDCSVPGAAGARDGRRGLCALLAAGLLLVRMRRRSAARPRAGS